MSARVGAFAFKEKAKKKLPFIMVRDCIIISKETVKIDYSEEWVINTSHMYTSYDLFRSKFTRETSNEQPTKIQY